MTVLTHDSHRSVPEATAPSERILLVDDDSNVRQGYLRSLGREFLLETAGGADDALELIRSNGPYAVVVSDLRMPGMNGIQMFSLIKAAAPDSVRVMLTGYVDTETAIDAINEGNIFRFLIKPCSHELMTKTLTAALVQYRLVTSEKQLLEQTLSGSIQVLTEVLSLVNPAAFSRAERARRYIHHVAKSLKLGDAWQYEVAAMLSQLGCVTLAPETIDAIYSGQKLTPAENTQYLAHPSVAYELLSRIPRLERIARMIELQGRPQQEEEYEEDPGIRRGAEMLRLILSYEEAIHRGKSRTEAAHQLARQNPRVSAEFFHALVTLDPNSEDREIRTCKIRKLVPGMITHQELNTHEGVLVIAKGQEITPAVISKLENLLARRAIVDHLTVSLPTAVFTHAKK